MIGPGALKGTVDLQNTAFQIALGPGFLTGMYLYNNASSVRYVKFYDKASPPTGADTPIGGCTFPVPPGGGGVVAINGSISFATNLYARATQGIGYTDNTAPAVNDVIVNFW